jgi:hypothetical protein
VDGDQGHRRRAGLGVLADVDAQVGDPAARGSDDFGALEVELGLLDRRARADQLGVVLAALAGALAGALQIRFGRLFLAPGGDEGGLRILDAAKRDRPRVFGVDLLEAFRVLLRVDELGVRCLQRLPSPPPPSGPRR